MTVSRFNEECQKRLIAPCLALENENLQKALRERDDQKALKILDEEF